jgi:hypothetical protein
MDEGSIQEVQERRRVPRHPVSTDSQIDMPATLNVRVSEISVLGVLLHAMRPLDVGARATLRMTLCGTPFKAEVQVRRVSVGNFFSGIGYAVGARFMALSPEGRELIERFVKL